MSKTGICLAVTAAAITGVAGIVPAAALAEPETPGLPQKLAGKTVFLDPGHQGPDHTQDVRHQVADGRGGTKDCQTSGMTTLHGIAEHTINWNVAQLVRTSLEGLGAHVVMSRADDTGWGGCIDERADAANRSGADVAVSIHADSGPADGHGFHLIVPQLPIPDAEADEVQSGAGLTASKAMRDAYLRSGFTPATYNGAVDGLQTRSDIAGPALTTVPDVFVEMGNGANAEDAQKLETPQGQLEHAVTITTGIASYLLGTPVPGDATGGAADAVPRTPAQPARAPQADSAQAPAGQPQTPASPPQVRNPSTATLPGAQAAPQAPAAQTVPQSQAPALAVPQEQAPAPQGQTAKDPVAGDPPLWQTLVDGFLAWQQSHRSGGRADSQPAAQPAGQPVSAPRPQSPRTPGGVQQNSVTPPNPGTQAVPGAQAPSARSGGLNTESIGNLIRSALGLIGPLAKMLIGGDGVGADLINLAYSLVSVLSTNLLGTK